MRARKFVRPACDSVRKGAVGFALTSFVTILSCAAPIKTPDQKFDGQYVGTPIATNAGTFMERPCRQGPVRQVTLVVVNGNATLLYNADAHLTFTGPVSHDGVVAIAGQNDRGDRGMSLSGVITDSEFNGRTAGLACNSEMRLERTSTVPPSGMTAVAPNRVDNLMLCNSRDPDVRIAACTVAIEAGHETTTSLSGAFFNRGLAYSQKTDVDRAIGDYDQVVRLDPNNGAAFINRGLAYRQKGNYDRAIQDFDQAIIINPNSAAVYNERGMTYRQHGDVDRAIADFDQAIRLNPDFAQAFLNRGNSYGALRDYQRAVQDYEQATRLDPKFAIPVLPITSHAVALDDYPQESIRMGEQGAVRIKYRVAETGLVTDCAIVMSSGQQRLDDAACAMARMKWKFRPAVRNGSAVAVGLVATVNFQLR